MKKNIVFIFIFLFFCSCFNKTKELTQNNSFTIELNDAISYFASIDEIDKNKEYLYIEANVKKDTTFFLITVCNGAFNFLNRPERLVNFLHYKGFDILLLGDFPNSIVPIYKNKTKNFYIDIVKEKYPNEFEISLGDPSKTPPILSGYKKYILVFKGDVLLKSSRQVW